MARLDLKELQNLSRLLLSENTESVDLGLTMVKQKTTYIQMVRRELFVAYISVQDPQVKENARRLLSTKFKSAQLRAWEEGFEIFVAAQKPVEAFREGSLELNRMVKQHENVRGDYANMLKQNPLYALLYNKAANLINIKLKRQIKLAEEYHKIALAIDPRTSKYTMDLSNFYKAQGRAEEALACLDKLASANPSDAKLQAQLGRIYRDAHNYDQAILCLKNALSPDANQTGLDIAALKVELAHTYGAKGQETWAIAEELFQQAIEHPNVEADEMWNEYAIFLKHTKKDYAAAETAFLKGIEIEDYNAELHGGLAELYASELNQLKKAEEHYEKMMQAETIFYHLTNFISFLVNQRQASSKARRHYTFWKMLFSRNGQKFDARTSEAQKEAFKQAQQMLEHG
ncbi:MAG: hypothetical protein MK212_09655 [Saprospiraceae bacterium]|nr:hypothetical protein [Saprospiraceae bacterium]